MPDSSPQDAGKVIATNLAEQGAKYPNAGASCILSALVTAGFAVVELPEPQHVTTATEDEHGWRTWMTEYGTVQVSDSGTVAIDRIYRFSDLSEEPGYLRAVAAAFLAAADAAETSNA